MSNKSKESKGLENLINDIEKSFGEGSVFLKGVREVVEHKKVPFEILALDDAIGGGVIKGRIIELFGQESSGKTTLLLLLAAKIQRDGGTVMFVDAEHSLDTTWASKLGVNVDEMILSQPDNGEDALSIVEKAVESNMIDLVIVDSVAALVPKAEIEGDMGDSKMGLQARLMSQAMRKLTPKVNKSETIVAFTNQYREKIGVMFGDPRVTTGGNALKFYASLRMEVAKGSLIKDGDEVVGNVIRCKVKKNKMAPPFRECEFPISYETGYDEVGALRDMATDLGIIAKSGSWYSYESTKLGQGKVQVGALLADNPELCEELLAKVKSVLNL